MPEVVAVLGATGFVGGAAVTALRERGAEVRPVAAPRLRWPERWPEHLEAVPDESHPEVVARLARQLRGAGSVVNAAGLAQPATPTTPGLYGANALLPALVSRACDGAGVGRYVHVSSAAVQGGEPLDETPRTAPFSPYSDSKALGERLLLAEPASDRMVFRPASIHDTCRPTTRSLVRLARSAVSCVAGDGSAPTPQALIGDLAASIAYLALAPVPGPVPAIVLQPHNGMTTGLLLRLLGGREPRHLPPRLARAAVRGIQVYGRLCPPACAHARRADLLLFGQPQVRGWLAEQGMVPALRSEAWQRLAVTSMAAVAA